MAMAAAFVILAEFLVRETLSEIVIAELDPGPDDLDAIFWSLTGLGFLLTAVLALSSGALARSYDEPEVQSLILALSPTVLMIALTAVPVALLRRSLQFRALSLRAVAGIVAGGIVGISLALEGAGIWSLVFQRLVQVATNIALAWIAVPWRPGLRVSIANVRRLSRFGGQMIGLRAAELSAAQLPSVLIGMTLGPVALGHFSVAWRLVEAGAFLIATPLRMAAQPTFAAMRRNAGLPSTLLRDLARLTGFVAFPALFGLVVLSDPVLLLLAGPEWEPAARVLSVLAFLGCYLCIVKVEQTFCLAFGQAGALTRIAWAEVAVAAVAVWVASYAGLLAMTGAYVATFYAFWWMRTRLIGRLAGVSAAELLRPHLVPAVAAAAMGAGVASLAVWLEPLPARIMLPICILAGVGIYVGLTIALMRDRLALAKSFVARTHSAPVVPNAPLEPQE